MTIDPLLVLLAALAIVWIAGFGTATARIAAARGRSPDLWFLFGAVIGPLALAIVWAAPPGACGICLSPVRGWGFACASCGSDVRKAPAMVRDLSLPAGPPSTRHDPDLSQLWASRRSDPGSASPSKKLAFDTGGRLPRRTSRAKRARRVSTAVFLEGSEPMETGATYALAIHGDDLRIMGPLDARPDQVVVSRRLGELATTALGDHLIITGTSRSLDSFHIVLTSVEAGSAQELARQLDAERSSVTSPTSSPS